MQVPAGNEVLPTPCRSLVWSLGKTPPSQFSMTQPTALTSTPALRSATSQWPIRSTRRGYTGICVYCLGNTGAVYIIHVLFYSVQDHVVLKSEVYFPNLQFETTEVLRIRTKLTNCILWPTRVNYFDFISTSLW